MVTISVDEAEKNLLALVDKAAAGQIITITRRGHALARLVSAVNPSEKRIGAMKGKLILPESFDDPLSGELMDVFEGNRK